MSDPYLLNISGGFKVHIHPPDWFSGFAQAWKVLEYTGLSWKVIENKFALKSTWKTLKGLEKSLNFTICKRIEHCFF